jgi:hypothetical protein
MSIFLCLGCVFIGVCECPKELWTLEARQGKGRCPFGVQMDTRKECTPTVCLLCVFVCLFAHRFSFWSRSDSAQIVMAGTMRGAERRAFGLLLLLFQPGPGIAAGEAMRQGRGRAAAAGLSLDAWLTVDALGSWLAGFLWFGVRRVGRGSCSSRPPRAKRARRDEGTGAFAGEGRSDPEGRALATRRAAVPSTCGGFSRTRGCRAGQMPE